MAAVPKRRTPPGRRDRRRANSYPTAKLPAQVRCEECGGLVRPYYVCPKCGYYRGHQVLQVAES
ncbi:MAG: 50S ribosomal protein L32 [Anaerolineae bacterium]|nr:50S ribosomal protein L32 [Anaerolineae bacterium]